MATDKRLFVVTVTTETVVLADDEREAIDLARDDLRDIVNDGSGPDITASEMTYYPGAMDDECIPYGHRDNKHPDRTIGEWIAEGAAPELTRRMVTLKAAAASE